MVKGQVHTVTKTVRVDTVASDHGRYSVHKPFDTPWHAGETTSLYPQLCLETLHHQRLSSFSVERPRTAKLSFRLYSFSVERWAPDQRLRRRSYITWSWAFFNRSGSKWNRECWKIPGQPHHPGYITSSCGALQTVAMCLCPSVWTRNARTASRSIRSANNFVMLLTLLCVRDNFLILW